MYVCYLAKSGCPETRWEGHSLDPSIGIVLVAVGCREDLSEEQSFEYLGVSINGWLGGTSNTWCTMENPSING